MVNKNKFSLVLIILFVAIINSVSCASESSVQLQENTSTDRATIIQMNRFLSGQLKGLVSSEFGELANYDYTSIRESIEKLLDNTNNILLTSYRESSKEYRNKCNFLMITVGMKSLLEEIDRLDECKEGCSEVQLGKIKEHIKSKYDYLTLKSSFCSQYLGI